MILRFDKFELDAPLFHLASGGSPVALEPRAFDLLLYLIRNRERVVSKAELLREVWPGVVVGDTVIGRIISELRRALGDDAQDPRYILTIRSRGFRFIHPMMPAEGAQAGPQPPDAQGSGRAPVTDADGASARAADREAAATSHPRRSLARILDSDMRLGSVPPLPRIFVGRQRELAHLRARLLRSHPRDCASRLQPLVALHGWPGVGKTTLAAMLARDPALLDHFPDAVLWCTLGQRPDIRVQLASWCSALRLPGCHGDDLGLAQMSGRLNRHLNDRRVLLIIDDLWEVADLAPFRVGGTRSAVLVTTRLPSVADALGGDDELHRLCTLPASEGLELLAGLAPAIVERHRTECMQLVDVVEGLPLALHVAANLLKAEQRRGCAPLVLLRSLCQDPRRLLAAEVPMDVASSVRTVGGLLARSSCELPSRTKQRFASLGSVDRRSPVFDYSAMIAAWGPDDPQAALAELLDRGLLELREPQQYAMHALIHAHAEELLYGSSVQ